MPKRKELAQMAYEYLREVFRVTEWRDGCVWKTESLGLEWVDHRDSQRGDLIFVTPSTSVLRDVPITVRVKR